MFEKKYLIVFIIILVSSILKAQPYYYLLNHTPIEGRARYTGDIYRINLDNATIAETLMTNIYELGSPFSDEYGNWLAYEDNFRLTIMSINNPINKNIIASHSEGIIKFSYVKTINKIIVLFYGDYPNPETMVIVDPASLTIIDTIPYGIHWYCSTNKDINFSKSGEIMYLIRGDSILQKANIASYSFTSKQIVKTKYIEELSSAGAEEFYFDFRRNGFGVIESWFNSQTPMSNYNIYFLDKDSLSSTIQRDDSQTWGNAYIANEGRYLLMFASVIPDSGVNSPLIGKIDIYDMTNGELKKTIQLPPDGQVMCFENYPNNVYYVKDIELPTRQVWNLDMDSIFNVLDLTSLNPNSVNINSDSFSLTINGNGFDTLSIVYFNGQPKTTTFISDSVLTTELLSSDFSVLGSFPVWVKDRYSISDTLMFTVTQASNPNLLINLKNSLGNQIPASNVTYYENSWKDAVNNGDGTFTVITTRPTVSIRVYYEYASLQADNVNAQNNTYTFTTVNAIVQLKNSLGNLIDAGTVQYYAGAWRSFGSTSNGVAYKELLPINYSFRMTYEYSSIDKQQNLSTDPTVIFQTVNAAVQLKDSLGNLIDAGTVQYYAGAWRSFGTTSNGVVYKELLPINYSFRMTYEYVSKDKQQNLNTNPVVDFSTVLCSVKVSKTSNNQPISDATVKYYAGAWRNLGTTNSSGIITKELLPANISFRATLGNVSLDKQQDISVNNLVEILLNVP